MEFINTLVNGLNIGVIYAMIALGYTMVYGIAKMLNFAHGDIIMVGGYTIYVFCAMKAASSPAFFFVAIAMAVIVCTLLGVIVEKVAYKPLRGASPLAVLITAIGVSYLLQSLSQIIFKSATKFVSVPELGKVSIGAVSIKVSTIITLVVSIAVMISLSLFVKYSKTGRAMIAVSEDRGAAQLMGININNTISFTFAVGSALAGIGSVLYCCAYPKARPTMGSMLGLKAFVAAVLGGIGSIPGAMAGGFAIGIAEALVSSAGLSEWKDGVVFAILIVVLLVIYLLQKAAIIS